MVSSRCIGVSSGYQCHGFEGSGKHDGPNATRTVGKHHGANATRTVGKHDSPSAACTVEVMAGISR